MYSLFRENDAQQKIDCILWNENLCEIIITKWVLISVHIKRSQRWIDEISFLSFNTFRFRHQILQTYSLLWAKSRAVTNFCKNSKFNVLLVPFFVEHNFKEITLDRETCKNFGIFVKRVGKLQCSILQITRVPSNSKKFSYQSIDLARLVDWPKG